jgi:hypothetical protein
MDKPIEHYWQIRLKEVKEALEANNFEVFLAADVGEARKVVREQILPAIGAKSVSWGGSMTFLATGLYEEIKKMPGLEILDAFDRSKPAEEILETRRKSVLADLFITGTNAMTEGGILVGRNKIVAELDDAMYRVKNYVAPLNAMRLDKKTPCVKTSYCEDCKSPDRICNVWTITEKSYPKGRIKVVLINQDLGL